LIFTFAHPHVMIKHACRNECRSCSTSGEHQVACGLDSS
jgi:hypothetical protein